MGASHSRFWVPGATGQLGNVSGSGLVTRYKRVPGPFGRVSATIVQQPVAQLPARARSVRILAAFSDLWSLQVMLETRIKASRSRDQYTTIVRSKPSQMVPNHPKSRRPQR